MCVYCLCVYRMWTQVFKEIWMSFPSIKLFIEIEELDFVPKIYGTLEHKCHLRATDSQIKPNVKSTVTHLGEMAVLNPPGGTTNHFPREPSGAQTYLSNIYYVNEFVVYSPVSQTI